ncbi:MAG: hypothetical protein HXX08_08405 [Chloroflexi bacterium]|uniref:Uncharacterized protein n=1 Tax=Candidatus Chlorohelix allophototropha TaxID=3003348 RepID=A0A8T7M3G0_9CHLR|nr:hypothetical protein [Chloroflexota bacterium]WJW67749.1 hypothetical protein OZ401_001024 [Chloroflexota bacterium L227-S17]
MQVVLFLIFGSLVVGYFYERLDRRVITILTVMVILGIVAYMYVGRAL